MRVLYLHWHIL